LCAARQVAPGTSVCRRRGSVVELPEGNERGSICLLRAGICSDDRSDYENLRSIRSSRIYCSVPRIDPQFALVSLTSCERVRSQVGGFVCRRRASQDVYSLHARPRPGGGSSNEACYIDQYEPHTARLAGGTNHRRRVASLARCGHRTESDVKLS
jgi:hypothetical protein